jgi:single-strand DNA-binding protein
MSSNNFVIIGGNLVRDPELKFTTTGKAIVNFTIGVNHSQNNCSFIECVAWNELANLINDKFKKGKYIKVSGTINQQKWTDKATGQNRSKITITANELLKVFSEKKQATGQAQNLNNQQYQQPITQQQANTVNQTFNNPYDNVSSKDIDDIQF